MPFGTYAELDTVIDGYLDRTDRTTEILNWFRLVEADVSRRLGLRAQDVTNSGTLTGGTNEILTPALCIAPRTLTFTTSPPRIIDVVASQKAKEIAFNASGSVPPLAAYVHGVNASYQTRIIVVPTPPTDQPYELLSTSAVTPLGDGTGGTSTSTYLLAAHPDIYLYGTLVHCGLFDEDDPRMARWMNLYMAATGEAKKSEWRARLLLGRAKVRPDHGAP